MQRVLWNLFNKTGDIKYYLLLSKIRNNKKKKQIRGYMVVKTKGIVLSETNYGETSKILNILTNDYGLIGIRNGC